MPDSKHLWVNFPYTSVRKKIVVAVIT